MRATLEDIKKGIIFKLSSGRLVIVLEDATTKEDWIKHKVVGAELSHTVARTFINNFQIHRKPDEETIRWANEVLGYDS